MRPSLVLTLAAALTTSSFQVALPCRPAPAQSQMPPTGRSACFELRLEHIAGAAHRWARLDAGDEWVTGCVGSPGECIAPIWVRC